MSDNEVETTTETPVETVTTEDTAQTANAETPAPSADENKPDEDAEGEQKPEGEQQNKELSEADKIKFAYQKRVNRQGAKISDLERERQQLLAELEKYKPKQVDDAPKEDQFQSVEEFLIAKGKYEAKKEFEAQQVKAKQEAEQAAYAQKVSETAEKLKQKEAEFRKTIPDYDDAVAVVNDFISDAMSDDPNSVHVQIFRDFVMTSENPSPILYQLGKNPHEIDRLSKLSPLEFHEELVLYKHGLKGNNAPKTTVRQVSAPPSPVKGSSTPKISEDELPGRELLKRYKLK